MATKLTTSAIHPKPLLSGHKHHRSSQFLNPNSSPHRHHHHHHLRLTVGVTASASPSSESSNSSEFNNRATDTKNNEEEEDSTISSVSTRGQLDLLEQLISSTPTSNPGSTNSSIGISIRDQLQKLVPDRDDDFSVPLGKNLKKFTQKFLTTSQKRNIRRQSYLNEVSKRNDSVFFATVGAFVLVPPLLILGIAVLTGYVQLFP